MSPLLLHEFHRSHGGRFLEINGQEAVADYGNVSSEHAALTQSGGILDLSYRGRLCVLGQDRAKFLHGQVTNNVNHLRTAEGCYAAIVSAKGRIQSDLHLYILENEILLEFEPGLADPVKERLEEYIIAEDAQILDVSEHYGLWSVQGPQSAEILKRLPLKLIAAAKPHALVKIEDAALGEIYLANRARTGSGGYDIFVPSAAMAEFASQLAATETQLCGWSALEIARIEAGIPRFGIDMDETNLAPEALGASAISYAKGCYIGQEIIARVRTYGQAAKALRAIRLPDRLPTVPSRGDKLFLGDKEVGQITSVAGTVALGYVRREANQPGTELILRTGSDNVPVTIVELPVAKS